MAVTLHRLVKALRNSPNLLMGYNLYVDTDKLRLIDRTFEIAYPSARSFADLGGVWKVDGGYSRYAVRRRTIEGGTLVDTDFPPEVRAKLAREHRLQLLTGDFTSAEITSRIGKVDVVFFFDVLLHQANPSWDEVLATYAHIAPCITIFNQQYIRGQATVRLTSLPLEEYLGVAPHGREEVYRYVYAHADDIHPEYGKPWRDIHNIFQWGITDGDLRATMKRLGYREVYYRNYGRFSDLPAFENHGFIFVRG
jgi:hypothetical protein